MYLREIVQLVLVAISLALGDRDVRQANNFNFGAIIEVAALFFGIFICMQPPLQILEIARTATWTDRAVALLLGRGQPVVVPRQRTDLRGLL